jgi:hypothetical protein
MPATPAEKEVLDQLAFHAAICAEEPETFIGPAVSVDLIRQILVDAIDLRDRVTRLDGGAIQYFTTKDEVVLGDGETLHFTKGRGYYAAVSEQVPA